MEFWSRKQALSGDEKLQVRTLAAELLDAECLLLFSTERAAVAIPDEMTARVLRIDPMGLFPGHQVNYADKGDRTIAAQTAEARRRWPEFEAAYKEHAQNGMFMVKAPFTENGNTEHMWFVVDGVADGLATGILANDPMYHRGIRKGDRVSHAGEGVTDWVYAYKGGGVGAFTDAQMRAGLAMR